MSIGNVSPSALPVWVREKRQPTKAELAAKHFRDGGTVGTAAPPDAGPSVPADAKSFPINMRYR
jgi:hypothetical protein